MAVKKKEKRKESKQKTKATTNKRGQNLGLSRDQIVGVAIEYADHHGVEPMSMRVLATQVGCSVMSLYNHVRDKDDLIDGMLDFVAHDIELPQSRKQQDRWHKDMQVCIASAYKVMLNHHWVAKYWGQSNGPGKRRYHETILRILRQAGFSEELACRGFHALTMHVVGFALQVMELRPIMTDKKKVHELGHQFLDEMDEGEYPYLREHVQFHLDGRDKRNDFKYMLELILAGLERDKADAKT